MEALHGMRTGQELLDASRPFTTEDTRKSWLYLLSTILLTLLLWAVTVSTLPMTARVAASILMGLMLVRLFIIYHDYQHGAILRRSRAARWIMAAYGLYILNPPSIWRRSHNYHHKHNAKLTGASIGSFPMMTMEQYKRASKSEQRAYAITRHPITILLGYLTIFIYGMCIRSFVVDPRRHLDSLFALILQVILLALHAAAGLDWLLLGHLIPVNIALTSGAYLFYAQHNFPDIELRDRTEWEYVNAALRSSSYMTMSRVMHWLTGNIGYHHVHHLNARIPFYRLPEAMDAIPELQSPGTTSWRPSEIAACLRLKLWDPEQSKMVGWNGR